jgi:hypothetical protein
MNRKHNHTQLSLEYIGLLSGMGAVGGQITQSDIESVRETHRKNMINACFVSPVKAIKR